MAGPTAFDVLDEIRSFMRTLGAVQEHKLLYYCQGWALAEFGAPLFDDEIEAWDNGPVVPAVWRHERHGTGRPAPCALAPEGRRVVQRVCRLYGASSGRDLIRDTHEEPPWAVSFAAGKNTVITVDLLQAYFGSADLDAQGWFWDEEWQEGEREADEEAEAGLGTRYSSVDELRDAFL